MAIANAIYAPPKDGLPFLVVRMNDGAVDVLIAESRSAARALLSRHNFKQRLVTGSGEQTSGSADQGS
jgi:hypothetical protein